LPLFAAALSAGWPKWALAAIARAATAMHAAFRAHWLRRARQVPPKKTPRLRAGRAARVGGKRRPGSDPSGAAKSLCRARRSGWGSNARCMVSSAGSRELTVSMGQSLLRRAPGARGRIRHGRSRIFAKRRLAGRLLRRAGRRTGDLPVCAINPMGPRGTAHKKRLTRGAVGIPGARRDGDQRVHAHSDRL
jgi:hypothetical protein